MGRGYTASFTDRSTGGRADGSRGRRSRTPAPGCPRRRDTRSAALPGERHRRRDRQGANLAGRLAFATTAGTTLDRHNVLRAFRPVVRRAGLDSNDWTPRELRHSFVSLLSDKGMSIEDIADLCGHSGTTVTESVYRRQLRPVLLSGAVAMDEVFGSTFQTVSRVAQGPPANHALGTAPATLPRCTAPVPPTGAMILATRPALRAAAGSRGATRSALDAGRVTWTIKRRGTRTVWRASR